MVTRLRLHASDISSGPFLFTGTEMRLYKLSAGVFRWVSTWVCSGVLYNGSVLVRSVLLQFDVVNSSIGLFYLFYHPVNPFLKMGYTEKDGNFS